MVPVIMYADISLPPMNVCTIISIDGLPSVKADLHRLSQVLYNLVGNACKFTSKGQIAVHAKMVGRADGASKCTSVH